MGQKKNEGCAQPSAGPIPPEGESVSTTKQTQTVSEVPKMQAKVGKPAPDFETNGYFKGVFENYRLSNYKGKWVLLCFYPGDFTFV